MFLPSDEMFLLPSFFLPARRTHPDPPAPITGVISVSSLPPSHLSLPSARDARAPPYPLARPPPLPSPRGGGSAPARGAAAPPYPLARCPSVHRRPGRERRGWRSGDDGGSGRVGGAGVGRPHLCLSSTQSARDRGSRRLQATPSTLRTYLLTALPRRLPPLPREPDHVAVHGVASLLCLTRSVKAGLQAVHQELDAEGEVCQAASGRGDATNNSAVDTTQPMTASDLRRSSTKRSCPPLGWSRVSCQGRSFNGAIIFWFGFSSLGIVFSCRSRPRRGSHAPCEVHACMDSNAAAVPDLSKAAKRHTAGGCAHGRSLQIRSH